MKNTHPILTLVGFFILSWAWVLPSYAGPSLPITKPPVHNPTILTGPPVDPPALQGQWFKPPVNGEVPEVRTHEFYDDPDGGFMGTAAITGYVNSITYEPPPGSNIVAFSILATIWNDTAEDSQWSDGDNSHGESLQYPLAERPYVGTMLDVKLTAEFAIVDPNHLPAVWLDPYINRQPYIVALDVDQAAWYCWAPGQPGELQPGDYYVPTWDFGDIPVGGSATRQLDFWIPPPGLDSTDWRYNVIETSYADQSDILLNRSTSLKISTWIDEVYFDPPDPEMPFRHSNVSVFHNVEDEDPPEPEPEDAKWVQPPDLSPWGFDVETRAMTEEPDLPILLADDFLCTTNSTITNIVIWASWHDDFLPEGPDGPDAGLVEFTLSFHADIPAGAVEEWSMPGETLWMETFPPGSFIVDIEAEGLEEGWYDPSTGVYQPNADTICWRYTFPVDISRAFVQTGAVENPVVYWLDVQAQPLGEMGTEPRFGWKTTDNQWNDAATWVHAVEPYNGQDWLPMYYPPGHELHNPDEPVPFDLAFMLFWGPLPEEEPEPYMDFGDAPDPPYPTLLVNDGARHIVDTNVYMGLLIDAELDGLPHPNALGDDLHNLPDEDGVVFVTPLIPGQTAYVDVTVSVDGYLSAWIDFNANGSWADAGDQLFFAHHVTSGVNHLSFHVPATAQPGNTFARFRFTTFSFVLNYYGLAEDGEVEDYEVIIRDEDKLEMDFGDAPDPFYPTLLANNGARHVIVPGVYMGAGVDAEPDGQPNADATGDDLDVAYPNPGNIPYPPGDEDGVDFLTPLVAGMTATVQVTVSTSGYLYAWIDFDADGSWAESHDQIFYGAHLMGAGVHQLPVPVPATATIGDTFARFRFTTFDTTLTYDGLALDGEVEDYKVTIHGLDFGDAWDGGGVTPGYPTLLAQDGARHVVVPGVYLGSGVDTEPDGQPSANADGDDTNLFFPGIPYPPGDEDGVIFPPVFIAGSTVTVQVIASVDGFLNTWIDWNMNGSWADPGEHVFVNQALTTGVNNLEITVPMPPDIVWGGPHTRWRFTTYAPAMPTFTGLEWDGEVEDHEILVDVLDFGDAPAPYPTLLTDDGARHRIPSGFWLGAVPPDAEPDGQPHPLALGDDLSGVADEDGVSVGRIIRGTNAIFTVVASTDTGYLNAWLDFHGTDSWGPGNQIATDVVLVTGANLLTVAIPSNAKLGPTFARFRYSEHSGLLPTGHGGFGEVEDYMFIIEQEGPSTDIVITNIVIDFVAGSLDIEWQGESPVAYETQYTTDQLYDTNIIWMPWGPYIETAPYMQTDTNAAITMKFYRVIAPYAVPPGP